jgi:orotate phosphoribosyltransferase
MLSLSAARARLLSFLRAKSIFHGDFLLSSGARSSYYIDCRLTTLDPEGAWLVGQVMHGLIKAEAASRDLQINSIGGLTMGADPIALATAMFSVSANEAPPWQTFVVRKTPKGHGQTKLIEGNFKAGDTVVVIDDVITKGDSTLKAIEAVEKEGGKVAFAAVLVDRQEGGRQKIEQSGHRVFAAFTRDELIQSEKKADFVTA